MSAINQIIKTILESEEGFAKSKQASNAANPGSGGGGGEPSSKATEVLAAPGRETLDKAADATGKATHPENDPKAKAGAGSKLTEEEDDDKKEFPFNNKKKKDSDEDEEDDDKKDSDKEDDEDEDKKDKKKVEEEIDVSEHVNALFEGETLSEEFRTKASTIFAAVIAERTESIRNSLIEEYEPAILEGLNEAKVELAERLDSYLDYVVSEFMTENKLQIERGLKSEITESFLNGLRNLFLSHDIEVPDAKVDVLGEMAEKVEALQKKLNEEVNRGVELKKEIQGFKKAQLIAEAGEGLASTDYEKLVKLCESVTVDSPENMKKKIGTIKESYWPSKKAAGASKVAGTPETQMIADEFENSANTEDGAEQENISEEIKLYANALGKYGKR